MTIEIQLISFLAFFLYGAALSIFYELFLRKKPYFCYAFFPLATLSFMYILFFLNGGRVHIYFIAIYLLGIFLSKEGVKFFKKSLRLLKTKLKK